MKCSREMNISVIQSYYRATKCSNIPPPGYRTLLFEEFKNINPDLDVTEQNLVDRKNIIFKNKYLPDTEINEIRRQIQLELEQEDLYENHGIEVQLLNDGEKETPVTEEENNIKRKQYKSMYAMHICLHTISTSTHVRSINRDFQN